MTLSNLQLFKVISLTAPFSNVIDYTVVISAALIERQCRGQLVNSFTKKLSLPTVAELINWVKAYNVSLDAK